MSKTRIYAVRDNDTEDKYLVRASSAAQAIAHVTTRFAAGVASQETLVQWLDDGIEVETAKKASGE
jgi:hypothetical protein